MSKRDRGFYGNTSAHQNNYHQRKAQKPIVGTTKKGAAMAVHDELVDQTIAKLECDEVSLPKEWAQHIDVCRRQYLVSADIKPMTMHEARHRLHSHIRSVFKQMTSSISDSDVWVIERILQLRYGTPNNNPVAPPEIWALYTCLEIDIAAQDVISGNKISKQVELVSAIRCFRDVSSWAYYDSGKIPKFPFPTQVKVYAKLGATADPTTVLEKPVFSIKPRSNIQPTQVMLGIAGVCYALMMERSGAQIFTTITTNETKQEIAMTTNVEQVTVTSTTTTVKEDHVVNIDDTIKATEAAGADANKDVGQKITEQMRETANRVGDTFRKAAESAIDNMEKADKQSIGDRALRVSRTIGKVAMITGGVAVAGYAAWALLRSTRPSAVLDVVKADINSVSGNNGAVGEAVAQVVRALARS